MTDPAGFDGQTKCDRCGMYYRGMTCDLCAGIAKKEALTNTAAIVEAALAVELPECRGCGGSKTVRYDATGLRYDCPMCDSTGRRGGPEAILRDKALKAELVHHWAEWNILMGSGKIRRDMTIEEIQKGREYHAAAIRRIAAALGVE